MKPSPSDLQRKMAENASVNYDLDVNAARVVKVRRLFEQLPPNQKVLDVGCADGAVLKPFAKVHQLHGVDICVPLAEMARKNGFQMKIEDIENNPLPYENGEFDVVLSGESIEHQIDTDWVLAEINRVLKVGGRLILTFPNVRTVVSLLMMAFLDYPPMMSARYRSGHYRDFTLKTMRWALQNHHFRMEKVVGSEFYFPWVNYFGRSIATYFPSWATVVIIQAVKEGDSEYSIIDATKNDIYDFHPVPPSSTPNT